MDLEPRPCPQVLPGKERIEQFDGPRGTVTILIDRGRAVMDIFAEHDVDPLDWDMACGLMVRMGVQGIGEPSYLAGVDTWHIKLKPLLPSLPLLSARPWAPGHAPGASRLPA